MRALFNIQLIRNRLVPMWMVSDTADIFAFDLIERWDDWREVFE